MPAKNVVKHGDVNGRVGVEVIRTENSVTAAAIRSRPECAASERIPRLAVAKPTTSFSPVMSMAASMEFSATARFSRRMVRI